MLSYLHKYHAGNFADLHKQLVLTEIAQYLQEKNKPFSMIDTHAGEGYYDLSKHDAKNYRELQSGLAPFFKKMIASADKTKIPFLINQYFDILKSFNPHNTLEKIPGSPLLLSQFLNPQTQLNIYEKHPSVFAALANNFSSVPSKLFLSNSDGYQGTKALLPPKEKRGLIFIDPSFEEKTEYEHITECLVQAIKRFSTGTYVLWYPILNNKTKDNLERLIKKLLRLPIQSLWQHEWHLEPNLNPETSGFYALAGSGILCIHLPWQADNHLNLSFDWLNSHLFPGRKCKEIWLKQPS